MLVEKIRYLMDKQEINQDALSKKTGKTPAALSYLLSGKTQDPKMSTLVNLAKALGTTVDYLLDGKPPDESEASIKEEVS